MAWPVTCRLTSRTPAVDLWGERAPQKVWRQRWLCTMAKLGMKTHQLERNHLNFHSWWSNVAFERSDHQQSHGKVRDKIAEALAAALYRNCTGCGVPTERTDACCHMTCSHCRAQFSWVCGADYEWCRANHPCLNSAIYLHSMPQLVAILSQRGLPATDENGSDLFLDPLLHSDVFWK